MYLDRTTTTKISDTITIQCDDCAMQYQRTLKVANASRTKRKSAQDFCPSCSRRIGATKRPQNSKAFWDDNRCSDKYYEAIANRPSIAGEANHMYGKKHTQETRAKMSVSRTGKTGENATAWKGGKWSFNRRIKSAIQRRWKWFSRVFERDDSTCQHCGATKRLDAHHIDPISCIIKRIREANPSLDEATLYEVVVNHPEVRDSDLANGITLCRECHRKQHPNWGSHEQQIHT